MVRSMRFASIALVMLGMLALCTAAIGSTGPRHGHVRRPEQWHPYPRSMGGC